VRRAPRGIHRRAPRICRLMTKYSRAHLPTYPAIAVTCAILFCGSPIEAAVLRARLGTASAPRRTPRSESSAWKCLSHTIADHLVADHGGDNTDLTDHDDRDLTKRLAFPNDIVAGVVVDVGFAVDDLAAV